MDYIYRVEWQGATRFAVLRERYLYLMEGSPFAAYALGDAIATGSGTDFAPALRVLAPVVPGKIVGIGLNYKDHAAEQGKPLPPAPMVFLKPPTAVIAPGDPILLPPGVGRIDHEAEMALVIGRRASRVSVEHAHEYILGVTCANDVTARDLQNKGMQFSHVKGYDTFAPLGPCISVGLDPADLAVEGWVNGLRRQGSRTRELIFPAAELVAYISDIMTLEPGDVISTGTPSGIAPLIDGDTVTVRVEGVGELTNLVQGRDRGAGDGRQG